MVTPTENQLDKYLDSVVNRSEQLRPRNLFTDNERDVSPSPIPSPYTKQERIAPCLFPIPV